MTSLERRAVLALGSLYVLRMLGLFMVLPVLALLGANYEGATPLLLGLALGVYGLTQALLQIPLGMASDRCGRKPIIIAGLLIFAVGSLTAATATSVEMLIVGRGLQGAGAIAAALMALLTDLTSEQSRSKAMATVGASIGVAFAVALILGPVITSSWGLAGLFWVTAVLALAGIGVVIWLVPNAPSTGTAARQSTVPLRQVLLDGQLMRLNLGVFVLHGLLTALFVVIPVRLVEAGGLAVTEHWLVYLPVMLLSFVAMVPLMIAAEKGGKLKPVFLGAVALLGLAEVAFASVTSDWVVLLAAILFLFFLAFNLLEATLPSMMSKLAPAGAKGAASGAYSTSQFLGAFAGGIAGGWLLQSFGSVAIYWVSALAVAIWLLAAATMTAPQANREVRVSATRSVYDSLAKDLAKLDGVYHVRYLQDKAQVQLRVDARKFQNSQLQALGLHAGN